MSSTKILVPENECSHQCQSRQHGAALASALSVRGVNSQATISYLCWMCSNCGRVHDIHGRTALHVAASCGRREVACWLIRHGEADVNLKDAESGYTPLHRSIFYGHIHVAVSLIQLGASTSCLDHDNLTALDHAMKDRMPYVEYDRSNPCEVYTWGTNNNYTLGVENQHGRPAPELLDSFRRQKLSIKMVAMQKFHSVFVTHDGKLYSCGHGQGGRLGLGSEQPTAVPRQVLLSTDSAEPNTSCAGIGCDRTVEAVSIGRDHTVILTRNKIVLTCGLNAHHQLGHLPPPPFLDRPRPVNHKVLKAVGTIQGVCAGRFHTVIWACKGVITFGLHAGQLGHFKSPEMTQTVPRLVSTMTLKDTSIVDVAASDGATVVLTDKSDIYVLHRYQCRKFACRNWGSISKVEVMGGHLDSKVAQFMDGGGDDLKIAVLTTSGNLLVWQESTLQFLRCVFSINRSLLVTDVALSRTNYFLLVTRDGEAFEGEFRARKDLKRSSPSSPAGTSGTLSALSEQVRVKRIPHVHRAVSAACDPKGRNFAVIQAHPQTSLLGVPLVTSSDMKKQMKALLQDAHIQDGIHDVVFLVGTREFPAHRFIVVSRSVLLAKLLEDKGLQVGEVPRVRIKNIKPEVFEQILLYIYSGDCLFLQHGSSFNFCGDSSPKEETEEYLVQDISDDDSSNKKSKNKHPGEPIKTMMEAAKRFGLSSLVRKLEGVKYEDGCLVVKRAVPCSGETLRFSLRDHLNLCDVDIISEENVEFRAHKCMISGRLEYFNSMLNHGWVNPSQTNKLKLPVPSKILHLLLTVIYEDDCDTLRHSNDLDLVSNALVVADEFFVSRMKEICEVTLGGLITLRNAAQVLHFADTYNAEQLKQCAMEFICLNLGAELEMRALEDLSDSVLEELSEFYRKFNPCMTQRIITPYSDAPSQSLVEAVAEAYPVKEDEAFESSVKKVVKSSKKKMRIRKTSVNENNKANERTRNESVSSNYSATSDGDGRKSLSFDDLTEQSVTGTVSFDLGKVNSALPAPWIKVTSSSNKQQKTLQARLKTITSVKENPMLVEVQENYTNIAENLQQYAPKGASPSPQRSLSVAPRPSAPVLPSSPSQAPESPPLELVMDFPELSSSSTHHRNPHPKPGVRVTDGKKRMKISQKQRKKMAAEGAENFDKTQSSPKLSWGVLGDQGNSSLFDIMREETKGIRQPASTAVSIPSQPSCSSANPWQKTLPSPVGSPETGVNFRDIVADEKKQRENLSKMRAKPLELTQTEDQAIEELLIFYNAAGVSDERITVRRVNSGNVATPTWIPHH